MGLCHLKPFLSILGIEHGVLAAEQRTDVFYHVAVVLYNEDLRAGGVLFLVVGSVVHDVVYRLWLVGVLIHFEERIVVFVGGDGQGYGERAALAFRALHLDGAAHKVDHLLHQRQAYAHTDAGGVVVTSVEFLEDMG